MKIFVALTLLVIATVTAKDLRIDSTPGLGFPGSGMAYDCFLGIGWIFILRYSITQDFQHCSEIFPKSRKIQSVFASFRNSRSNSLIFQYDFE